MARKKTKSKVKNQPKKKTKKKSPRKSTKESTTVSAWLSESLKKYKFLGLALGGGKTDRSCLALVEYFPNQQKVFLSGLEDKIRTTDETSADTKLHQLLQEHRDADMLAINAPLSWPKCVRCKLNCPGYETCTEPEIVWMWGRHRKSPKKKKLKKLFTPYTERCAEQFIASELEEPFHPPHALGANLAPVTARAHFILRRTKLKKIEVYPRTSLWRIGRALGIQKSYLRSHGHSLLGQEARESILHQLVDRDIAFIYEQDLRTMSESSQAFEAFICALTAVLKHRDQCEKIPKGFPRSEGWIEIPSLQIDWGI